MHGISGLLVALLVISVAAFLGGAHFGGVRKQSSVLFLFSSQELFFAFKRTFQRKYKQC